MSDRRSSPPRDVHGVPLAASGGVPCWPVATLRSYAAGVSWVDAAGERYGGPGRAFGDDRRGGARAHAGIDVEGRPGDLVVAPEGGRLVRHYHFYKGTHALFMDLDGGLTVNLGEVAEESWGELGLAMGDAVGAGEPVARVGDLGGYGMCHFETYLAGTPANKRLIPGRPRPPELLDPTAYLLTARQAEPPACALVLRRESRGRAVEALHRMLRDAFMAAPAVGDVFDRQTENDVLAFQAHARIGVDGVVGPKTWAALYAHARAAPL